jgi:hypothetical protein
MTSTTATFDTEQVLASIDTRLFRRKSLVSDSSDELSELAGTRVDFIAVAEMPKDATKRLAFETKMAEFLTKLVVAGWLI